MMKDAYLYFLIYFSILSPYILLMVKVGKVFQINIPNFFVFAHFLLFVLTPIVFQQDYIVKDRVFCGISYISLIAILFAITIRLPKLSKVYFEPRLELIKWVFYLAFALAFLDLISGIANVSSDRTMAALESEYEGRGPSAFISVFMKLLMLVYFGYLYSEDKKKFLVLYVVYLVSLVVTSAHRTPVLIALMSPVLLHYIYTKSGKVKPMHLFAMSFVIAISMFFMNFYRQGIIDKVDVGSGVVATSFLNTLRGINTTKNLYDLIDTGYEIEYLAKVHYMVIGFVPRKLYPDKPVVSFNVRTTENLYGYKVGEFKGADVITYTVPGEGYIQLSFAGVFIFTFLSVFISRALVRFYLCFRYIDFIVVSFLFSIFINFRSAFDSFYYSVVYGFVYMVLLIPFYRIKVGKLKTKLSLLDSPFSLIYSRVKQPAAGL